MPWIVVTLSVLWTGILGIGNWGVFLCRREDGELNDDLRHLRPFILTAFMTYG
jgi:hypothetical protein